MATKQKAILELTCQYGDVGIGERTCRITARVDRSRLKSSVAERNLCGRRLTVVLHGVPAGDDPEQQRMFEDARTIDGVCDVRSFSVSPKYIGFTMTFSLEDIDLPEFSKYAKRSGRIDVMNVAVIPDDDESEDEEESIEPKPKRGRRAKASENGDTPRGDADL